MFGQEEMVSPALAILSMWCTCAGNFRKQIKKWGSKLRSGLEAWVSTWW